jgi:hypothetical protein
VDSNAGHTGSMPSRLEMLVVAEILITQQPQGVPTSMLAGKHEKLPSKSWKGTTQQGSKQELSPLWHAWSNCKREECQTVLQEKFRAMARVLKLPKPVATVEFSHKHALLLVLCCPF